MSTLQRDQEFWDNLKNTRLSAIPDDQWEQLDRVRNLNRTDLAELLLATGYRYPPPPPIDELVDPLVGAISQLGQLPDSPNPDAAIDAFRRELYLTSYRIERELRSNSIEDLDSRLTGLSKQLGTITRKVLPAVIVNAASVLGGAVAATAAGTALGPYIGPIVSNIITEAGRPLFDKMRLGTADAIARQEAPDGQPVDEYDEIIDELTMFIDTSEDGNVDHAVAHTLVERLAGLHEDRQLEGLETLQKAVETLDALVNAEVAPLDGSPPLADLLVDTSAKLSAARIARATIKQITSGPTPPDRCRRKAPDTDLDLTC